MSVSGIHGKLIEITVVGCNKLKDTEWISRQDPYVCLEYGSTKYRTRTCTDGGKNPTFQEKFVFTLIEGLRELNVVVWNSNTLTYDDFIGNGKVQLHKVLSHGYDDSSWTLQTKTGRYAGEVRLIMHYADANPAKMSAPSAPPFVAPNTQVPIYSSPAPATAYPSNPTPSAYPAYTAYPPSQYPSQPALYPPIPSAYPPPSLTSAYPPPPSTLAYPPPPSTSAYPPPPSVSAYPPPPSTSAYPPPPSTSAYPPSPYYPPGSFPGLYPPPPY